jgi:hypothetical protein
MILQDRGMFNGMIRSNLDPSKTALYSISSEIPFILWSLVPWELESKMRVK